jgi:hypothetical protein
MPIHNPLEYEEEGQEDGLFTDEEDVSNAIAASLASAKAEGHQEAGPSTPPSRVKVTLPKVHKVGIGAKTLRDYCSKSECPDGRTDASHHAVSSEYHRRRGRYHV